MEAHATQAEQAGAGPAAAANGAGAAAAAAGMTPPPGTAPVAAAQGDGAKPAKMRAAGNGGPRHSRNYAACLSCRTRKVRCDLGDVESPGEPPCVRCRRERKECVFVDSRKGRRPRQPKAATTTADPGTAPGSAKTVRVPKRRKTDAASVTATDPSATAINTPSQRPLGLPPLAGPTPTMVYLAHVAGNIARPDERDRIDAKQRIAELEGVGASDRQRSGSSSGVGGGLREGSPVAPSIMRTPSVSTPPGGADTEPIVDSFAHHLPLLPPQDSSGRFRVPPPRSTLLIRPHPGARLSDIEYVCETAPGGPGCLLTEQEARRLVSLFFITMHPFYPYIPAELHNADVLPGYPMLLCTILTIATRYHLLPDEMGAWDNPSSSRGSEAVPERSGTSTGDPNGDSGGASTVHNAEHSYKAFGSAQETQNRPQFAQVPPAAHHAAGGLSYAPGERHIAVHEQLWIYAQRLMSMTVWGESSSRSLGTVLSFLLFTEWNPRAIHFRWSDYANSAEDESAAPPPMPAGFGAGSDPEYAGLSAMKRSEIMSFMLVGTATRLSFLLDDHPLLFLATHISETHTSIGLHKKSMLQQTLGEVDIADPRFKFTAYQCASVELLQFLSLCYETLYGTKPKFITLDKYQTLAILDILSPVLENWYRKYYKLLKPSHLHSVALGKHGLGAAVNGASASQSQSASFAHGSRLGPSDAPSVNASEGTPSSPDWLALTSLHPKLPRDLNTAVERESLILDYYYTKLYLYSLALSGDTSVSANLRNSKKGRTLRLDELARYSRYVELAYKAAKEVLNVILRVKKLKLLRYIPVRWVTRVIKAVSFIVKCYLTLTNVYAAPSNPNDEILKLSVIPLEEIITLLQKTAICLRDATPDELHLCTRYSTILMYLCSQFKSKMKERRKGDVREYERDMDESVPNTEDGGAAGGRADDEPQHTQQVPPYKATAEPSSSEANVTSEAPATETGTGSAFVPPLTAGITGTGDGGIMNVGAQVGVTGTSLDNPPVNLDNANQDLFDDLFKQNPSETLFNWFSTNDNNPGLDFVDRFTNEIERDLFSKNPNP